MCNKIFIGLLIILSFNVARDRCFGTVVNVEAQIGDRAYQIGEQIWIIVHFSETITVTLNEDIPTLALTLENGVFNADYTSGSGTRSLWFVYTTKNGDHTNSLNYANTNALKSNKSVIQDMNGLANLKLPSTTTSSSLQGSNVAIVDRTAPKITGAYVTGILDDFSRGNCQNNGFVFVQFDEGVYTDSGVALSDTTFEISGENLFQQIFCGIRNQSGGSLTGGESTIRLEYFLDIVPGSNFQVILNEIVEDASGNTLDPSAVNPLTLEVNRTWAYNINANDAARDPPLDITIKFGRGPFAPATDQCHDHICEAGQSCPITSFYLYEPQFNAPFQELTRYERFIGEITSSYELFIDPLGGEDITTSIAWSPADTDPDLNDDYILVLKPLEKDNPLTQTLNMTAVNAFGPFTYTKRTGFRIHYGPLQELDTTPPEIQACAEDQEHNLIGGECLMAMPDLTTEVSASDDFAESLNVNQNIAASTLLQPETYVTKLTTSDNVGNEAVCYSLFTIRDTIAPTVTDCPNDIETAASGTCTAAVSWDIPTGQDNCNSVSLQSDHNPGEIFPFGETTVKYIIADDSGNESDCSFDVTVFDDTAPAINCPENIQVTADVDGLASATWDTPATDDNCSSVSLTVSHESGSMFAIGETEVTYTAKDETGNSRDCRFMVMVEDEDAPVIMDCPQDQTVLADSNCSATANWSEPKATDNGTLLNFSSTFSSGDIFMIGSTTVTYTAEDDAGNRSQCSFVITVEDITAPDFADCPDTITASVDSACVVMVDWTPPAPSDNCSIETISASHVPGDLFSLGNTQVTYRAIDGAENVSECQFTISAVDREDPKLFDCPEDITVTAETGECSSEASWDSPTFTDNCPQGTILSSHQSGTVFPVGATEITYTAMDEMENSATCTFQVIVEDKELPILECSENTVFLGADGVAGLDMAMIMATSTDNCGIESINISQEIFTCEDFPESSYQLSGTDGSGNSSECSVDVIIEYENPEVTNVQITSGWNLISSPVSSCDNIQEIFGETLLGNVWSFNPNHGLQTVRRVEFQRGYFLFSKNDDEITITGNALAIDESSIVLGIGWNLIGPNRTLMNVSTSEFRSPVWHRRDNRFEPMSNQGRVQLEKGRGYWINTDRIVTIP